MLTATYNFFQKIIEKSDFPIVKDVNIELNKLNLLRIVLGIIVFIRTSKIAYAAPFYYNDIEYILAAFAALTGTFFLLIGFLTPATLLCIILLYSRCDRFLATITLGTNIFIMMSMVMLFCGVGTRYSVDGYILRRFPNSLLARMLRKMYNIFGSPNAKQLTSVYFFAFLSFALLSFAAIMFHLQDPFWVSGNTNQIVFTSSYLSRQYVFFRWFESMFPGLLFFISASSVVGQSIFQFFAIPLMFWKLGRWFVVGWGIIFFGLSIFVLQLSYLPWLELVMWTTVFYRPNSKPKIGIVYDDFSKRDKKKISFLSTINFNNRFAFLPFSSSKKWTDKYEIEEKERITVIHNKNSYTGYGGYKIIAKANPILCVFIPFLYLANKLNIKNIPFIGGIGKISTAYKPLKFNSKRFYFARQKGWITKVIVTVWTCIFILYLSFFPIIEDYTSKKIFTNKTSREILWQLKYHPGLTLPRVFNPLALGIGQYWNVVYRVNSATNERTMVPFHGTDGERKTYIMSDVLYYGNSLQYRRGLVVDRNKDGFRRYHEKGNTGYYYMRNLVRFDYNYTGQTGEVIYEYDIIRNQLTNIKIPKSEKYDKVRIRTGRYKVFRDANGKVIVEILKI